MKNLILKNKYLFLTALFLLTVAMSVSASYTIAKYTKTVDVGTIQIEFTKEELPEQQSESHDGTYTVRSGDTLLAIAKMYNTTVSKLAAYNGIDDPGQIKVDQVLIIPPQNYVIPESSEPQDLHPADPSDAEPSDTETTNETEQTEQTESAE